MQPSEFFTTALTWIIALWLIGWLSIQAISSLVRNYREQFNNNNKDEESDNENESDTDATV